MNRHLIVGRLGPDDLEPVPCSADEQTTLLQLVSGNNSLGFGIETAITQLGDFGISPSEIGLDLLVLAAHIHAADTRISRAEESQDSWTREIRLVVPVSDAKRWSSAAALLERMLGFLTGDQWVVGFRERPKRFSSHIVPRTTLIAPPFDSLSLFSGGLDSLIGAIDLMERGRVPLLVSHAGDSATSEAQQALFEEMENSYPDRGLSRLRLWMTFQEGLVKGVSSENTTRGRSFLFIALGVFAGTSIGREFVLHVPENGLIALNVPLDPLRLGAHSTRTTHPYYLARWNELLKCLGIAGRVENPYWNRTKGEMVRNCSNQALLERTATRSLSCAHPTEGRWQGEGVGHCGYCLPCLIRRAAISWAWGQDPTSYRLADLNAAPLDTGDATGKQVRSFQVAIERLGRNPGLARLLIHKPGPMSDECGNEVEWAAVFQRGLREVGELLSGVRTKPG